MLALGVALGVLLLTSVYAKPQQRAIPATGREPAQNVSQIAPQNGTMSENPSISPNATTSSSFMTSNFTAPNITQPSPTVSNATSSNSPVPSAAPANLTAADNTQPNSTATSVTTTDLATSNSTALNSTASDSTASNSTRSPGRVRGAGGSSDTWPQLISHPTTEPSPVAPQPNLTSAAVKSTETPIKLLPSVKTVLPPAESPKHVLTLASPSTTPAPSHVNSSSTVSPPAANASNRSSPFTPDPSTTTVAPSTTKSPDKPKGSVLSRIWSSIAGWFSSLGSSIRSAFAPAQKAQKSKPHAGGTGDNAGSVTGAVLPETKNGTGVRVAADARNASHASLAINASDAGLGSL
ncbi:mucin-7-like isoform X2 [Amphibalanus amphitrite]|nr:mucin-7-like isoform X2 [Amphibalanus amphitrite]XP_043201088.1 mucin-7-like isoform X2 [Amphibalanus amphitrite]